MTQNICIMRHGEKPANGKKGILLNGKKSVNGLTVQGLVRAGALSIVFNDPDQSFELFACYNSEHSQRCYDLLYPLAQLSNATINTNFKKGQEKQVAKAAMKSNADQVFIVWEHDAIYDIAKSIVAKEYHDQIPKVWPDDRYDMTYRIHN